MKINSFSKAGVIMMGMSLLFSCSRDGGIQQKSGDDDKANPVKPPVILYTPEEANISAGYQHTLILSEGGLLSGWGKNENGELGATKGTVGFMKINNDMWSSISAGYNFSIGVKKDGTLWAAGYNSAGQLGTGNTNDSPDFVQVGKDSDWLKVSAGYRHTLAIKKDGTIWAWGLNESFQLGDGSDAPSFIPKKVGNENDWRDIAAGNKQSFAIKKDGSLWAWGYNYAGQLGLGHTNNISVPTKVSSDKWKTIVAGILTTGGIREDGSLWMWGRNYHGELGVGTGNLTTNTYSYIPVQVEGVWKKLSIGKGHVLAIKNDNTLWAWGNNSWGEIGFGNTGYKVYYNKPIKIGNGSDWKDISAGETFSIAQKQDLTYWGWGKNREKQVSLSIDKDEITEPMKIK